jgi:ferritin-like protein
MASEGFHEPIDKLSPGTLDRHRAIISLMEEFEAIDWYDQRVDATDDESLAEVLAHNRDDEKEHAAMTLEWLRRRDPVLDEQLRTYLFTEGSILEAEDEAMGRDSDSESAPTGGTSTERGSGLGIGSLRRDDLPEGRTLPE